MHADMYNTPHNKSNTLNSDAYLQSGHTMIEIIAVIAIVSLLSFLGIRVFKNLSVSLTAKDILNDIGTMDHQHQANTMETPDVPQPPSGIQYNFVKNEVRLLAYKVSGEGLTKNLANLVQSYANPIYMAFPKDIVFSDESANVLCLVPVGKCSEGKFLHGGCQTLTPSDKEALNKECRTGNGGSGSGEGGEEISNNELNCNANEYPDGGTCKSCGDYVANCDDNGTITECEDTYYKSGNNCIECPDHTATCDTDGFMCAAGYYKNGEECEACDGDREYSSAGATACLTCDVGTKPNSDHSDCEDCASDGSESCGCDGAQVWGINGCETAKCLSNDDCELGEYCNFGDMIVLRYPGCQAMGECKKLDDGQYIECQGDACLGKIFLASDLGFSSSTFTLQNWCQAHGYRMATPEDLGLKNLTINTSDIYGNIQNFEIETSLNKNFNRRSYILGPMGDDGKAINVSFYNSNDGRGYAFVVDCYGSALPGGMATYVHPQYPLCFVNNTTNNCPSNCICGEENKILSGKEGYNVNATSDACTQCTANSQCGGCLYTGKPFWDGTKCTSCPVGYTGNDCSQQTYCTSNWACSEPTSALYQGEDFYCKTSYHYSNGRIGGTCERAVLPERTYSYNEYTLYKGDSMNCESARNFAAKGFNLASSEILGITTTGTKYYFDYSQSVFYKLLGSGTYCLTDGRLELHYYSNTAGNYYTESFYSGCSDETSCKPIFYN